MPATVINSYSTELVQGLPPLYAPLKTNQAEGRVRHAMFTKQFATEAAGEDVALCELPRGARIIDGVAQVSATTGTATLAFGLMDKAGSGFIDAALTVSDDVATLRAAATIVTTAQVALAATQLNRSLYEVEKVLYVTVTTAVAAMAGQLLNGFVRYVVD